MKAINKREVIKKIGSGTMTEGGIYTPDMGNSKDDLILGTVENIAESEDNYDNPDGIKVGDEVIFCKSRAEEITLNIKNKLGLTGDCFIIFISDILIVK